MDPGPMAADPRFDFYEKVIVASNAPPLSKFNGELGLVEGRSFDHRDGRWSYAVGIYREALSYCCEEDELRPTGLFDRPAGESRDVWLAGDGTPIDMSGRPTPAGWWVLLRLFAAT